MTKINTNAEKIKEILSRGVEDAIVKESLAEKLVSGKKLTIKVGADPSSPDLHLGHSVVLRKLKEFQDLGHKIVFIIGDFTAKIGDPSGKSKTRPSLSAAQIKSNSRTYFKQVKKILDDKNLEIRNNSEWFLKEGWNEVLKLTSRFTIARILERDDFSKRFKEHSDIAVYEILYPLMQAYDSVKISADIEIGGTDQKFNLLAGRELQKKMGLPEQDIITVPLLVGMDGTQKMSKSLGNYIAILDKPFEMYGKIMSLPDSLIVDYFKLTTNLSLSEIQEIEKKLKNGKVNPRDVKSRLGKEIVSLYHNAKSAEQSEREFNKIFKERQIPSDIPVFKLPPVEINILDLLVAVKLAPSKSQAQRLVDQKAVEINNLLVDDWRAFVKPEKDMLIKAGKRGFAKIS